MWTLGRLLAEVGELFFPPACAVCGEPLTDHEELLCTLCRITAPLTGYEQEALNPVLAKFDGLVPVERASAMLFFQQQSGWQRLIHDFKYHQAWRIARQMGIWYGNRLRQSGLYDDIDLVVPMPLHPLKQLRRGYNQSSYLAEGIASVMGLRVARRAVRRRRNTSSQAQTPIRQRASNVEDAFSVRTPRLLQGKHLLLVDDVLTTGSTMISLIEAIRQAVPDCRISVAVLAAPRAPLGEE